MIIGNVELFAIEGGGNRPLGQNLPSSNNHLRTAFTHTSLRSFLDFVKSNTSANMLDALMYCGNHGFGFLGVFNTSRGIEYYPVNTYSEIFDYLTLEAKAGKEIQVRYIFDTTAPLENIFSCEDIARIRSDADLLNKLREIEYSATGKCKYPKEADDLKKKQPSGNANSTKKKDQRPAFSIGKTLYTLEQGGLEKDASTVRPDRSHLRSAFSEPSVRNLQDLTRNSTMKRFFSEFIYCLKQDYAALAVVFHPTDRKIVFERIKTEEDLEEILKPEESESTSPQIRSVVRTSQSLHGQIDIPPLSKIKSDEDILEFFRNIYLSRGYEYPYTAEDDKRDPLALGPYSPDVNMMMNCFSKLQKQAVDMKYCWFYQTAERGLEFFASDEALDFHTVRLSLTTRGRQNDVMLALDLSRAFDEQLFDYDLSQTSYADLTRNPIDIASKKGRIEIDSTTPAVDKKIIFISNCRPG